MTNAPDEFAARLPEISRRLLREESDYEGLKQTLREFHDGCAAITGIRGDGDQQRNADLRLPGGTAISPEYAAHTVFDMLRTKRFVQGLHAAIGSRLKRTARSPLHVLYAGCGPYATLALPLMGKFGDRVRWTLLDIQPASLAAARRLFAVCGFTDVDVAFVEADASQYRHAGAPIDLVVTETMQNLLEREPQVAITLNLAMQLAPDGILVPQRISIDAEVVTSAPVDDEFGGLERSLDPGAGTSRALGRAFELDLAFARGMNGGSGSAFPAIRLPLPPHAEDLRLRLQTRIQVFEDYRIEPGNSPLCLPRSLPDWSDRPDAAAIEFRYESGARPGLRCTYL